MNDYENKNPYQDENGNPNGYQNSYQGEISSTYSNNNYNQYNAPYKKGKGLAIASMVLGIVSLTIGCCSGIGFICALLGFIFGIIAQKKNRCGMAVAGIITSVFGMLWGLIIILLMVLQTAAVFGFWGIFL